MLPDDAAHRVVVDLLVEPLDDLFVCLHQLPRVLHLTPQPVALIGGLCEGPCSLLQLGPAAVQVGAERVVGRLRLLGDLCQLLQGRVGRTALVPEVLDLILQLLDDFVGLANVVLGLHGAHV